MTRPYELIEGVKKNEFHSNFPVYRRCTEQVATTGSTVARQHRQRRQPQQFIQGTEEPSYPGTQATPQTKPINFDEYNAIIIPVVLGVAVFMQISLPFILWWCASRKKSCKAGRTEGEDERRMEQVGEGLERRLQTSVAAEGSQEDLDQAVQEYQIENEAELNRKRGMNVSLCRIISLHMYFSFYLWVIYLVGCDISQCTRYGFIFYSLRIFAMVMLCVAPAIVLIESFFCRELRYLKNIMQDETAWEYIQRMHEVPPKINMVVQCYHYETRTRVVYYTDARGNRQSRTETYEEQVVTCMDHAEFTFGSWVDVSNREMPVLSTVGVTRVKIYPSILFGDQETADDYQRRVEEMLERNRDRDVFTDYSSNSDIPGLKKRISAYVDLRMKPFWIRSLFFWIATLLQMTWPYRWLFRAKTAKEYYTLKKKIYKSATPAREANLMAPIVVVVDNTWSVVDSSPGSSLSEMNNPGTGSPTPYPQESLLAGTGNLVPRVSHLPAPWRREDERPWERG
ncbi:hypothetical protein OS493_021035 [Desmophyllum pertusum]|uniref:Transmembrane protein 151B n=1 Tax=Desmophyllum pertusum TaxID=174260 RepID=A0A9X0A110_9CNID|nr:hypothetical protein OS493_021035 [Desmophyllum pertusum]